jgi:PAS domain S-box-containing protein
MSARSEPATLEIKRLRRCMNDLLGLLALPAMWSGGNSLHILQTLEDALVSLVRLDFVYMRLADAIVETPIEVVKVGRSLEPRYGAQEIGQAVRESLRDHPHAWQHVAQVNVSGEAIPTVAVRLGLQGEIGVMVAGARRPNFPRETESLVLNVAANQAVVGLQQASLLGKEKRVTGELSEKIAQRSSELVSANQKLHKEIAERRRAEDALSLRELSFQLLVDSIPAPVAIMTADGEVDAVNGPVLEYFGKTVDQLKSWGTTDAVHPDDLAQTVAEWRKAVESGFPYEIESRHRRADGLYRWFNVRGFPLRDIDGRIVRWCVLQTDIDDRKRAEQALAASERHLNLIINTIPALAWSARADGSAEFFNQHYLDYLGLSPEQVEGTRWTSAVHPDDVDGLVATWQLIMASRGPGEAEARLRRFDGEYRWFLFRANPLRDEAGDVVKWFGVNTDIEGRKRAEEELRDTQAELAHMTRVMTMGVLTASIAHEVNQPLAGIITNANTCLRMLAADSPNVEGARETARRTIRDANRASEVVKRLRELFSRKERTNEPVDLNDATREVLALSSSLLQRSRMVLRSDLDDSIPFVMGDRVQLQQVIMNLLLNAADAMSGIEDGQRLLEVRTERNPDNQVLLTVKDTGIGFDPKDVEKLFQEFRTTKSDGMGIGLSVSRSIIQSHHGSLWGALNNGPGATFSFSVPGKVESASGVGRRDVSGIATNTRDGIRD